jgi:hypothetical protein
MDAGSQQNILGSTQTHRAVQSSKDGYERMVHRFRFGRSLESAKTPITDGHHAPILLSNNFKVSVPRSFLDS